MSTRHQPHGDAARSAPCYELRVRHAGPGQDRYEVWQVPAATAQLRQPARIAGLEGRNLELVQHRILRVLADALVAAGVASNEER